MSCVLLLAVRSDVVTASTIASTPVIRSFLAVDTAAGCLLCQAPHRGGAESGVGREQSLAVAVVAESTLVRAQSNPLFLIAPPQIAKRPGMTLFSMIVFTFFMGSQLSVFTIFFLIPMLTQPFSTFFSMNKGE